MDWAKQIGQPVLPKIQSAREQKLEPATLVDNEYSGSELVPVRRLVYRVTLLIPAALRAHRPPVAVPAGELHVDVGEQRLRARFVGPGWPVDEGSEVRLRADVPGVYLFDGDGGRPLAPGHLAGWFQGEVGMHARTDVRVRHEEGAVNDGPGDLLCALLAEWTQYPRDEIMPRCGGSFPPAFRFGLLAAELTAVVPLNLPRAHLRADPVDPPAPLATKNVRLLVNERDWARITPSPVHETAEDTQPDAAVGGDGLAVVNRTPGRVVVIVQGIPIGWVKPESSGRFDGLAPGYYHIAALRPAGQFAMTPALTRVPGELHFGRPETTQLREPLLGSPEAAR